MAIQVSKTKSFRIGLPSENWMAEYPELKTGRYTKSLTGEMIVNNYNCKTWADFFQKNPLKFPVEKTFYVYEVGSDGAVKDTGYITEGQFQPYKIPTTTGNLGDEYAPPVADTPIRSENNRLRNEIEKLHIQNAELHELIAERDKVIKELQEKEREWYMTGKLPLELQVSELNHTIEKLKQDKENTVQTLNDNWEAQRKKDKDEEEMKALKNNVAALLDEKKQKESGLSGLQSTAAAIAPTVLSVGLEVLEKFIEKRNPGMIDKFLKRLGGEQPPEPVQELDPAAAFQTGQQQTI